MDTKDFENTQINKIIGTYYYIKKVYKNIDNERIKLMTFLLILFEVKNNELILVDNDKFSSVLILLISGKIEIKSKLFDFKDCFKSDNEINSIYLIYLTFLVCLDLAEKTKLKRTISDCYSYRNYIFNDVKEAATSEMEETEIIVNKDLLKEIDGFSNQILNTFLSKKLFL